MSNVESGWTTIQAGNGEKVELAEGVPWIGSFLGFSSIEITDKKTGVVEEAQAIRFEDEAGDPCFLWGTYQLVEALEQVETGATVRITWLGKTDLDGGRTVNRYRVEVKA